MNTDKIFNIDKINLIIQIVKPAVEKNGSYRFTVDMTDAEEVEIRKHFDVEFLYLIQDKKVYNFKLL